MLRLNVILVAILVACSLSLVMVQFHKLQFVRPWVDTLWRQALFQPHQIAGVVFICIEMCLILPESHADSVPGGNVSSGC